MSHTQFTTSVCSAPKMAFLQNVNGKLHSKFGEIGSKLLSQSYQQMDMCTKHGYLKSRWYIHHHRRRAPDWSV